MSETKKIYCAMCKEEKEISEFTKFTRNPSLADRQGCCPVCRTCASQYVIERGNTKVALREILRIQDIPYLESYADTALETYIKKRQNTNVVTKKNLYDDSETQEIETINRPITIYTCYSARVGLLPKKYTNFSFSDGVRDDSAISGDSSKAQDSDEDKSMQASIRFLKKTFGDEIYNDRPRLAKAVKLMMEELSLHKNNNATRQAKFRLKNHVMTLLDAGILERKYYVDLINDDVSEVKEDEDAPTSESTPVKKNKQQIVVFEVPSNVDLNALAEKWGFGHTPEELYLFEKKYQMLKNNYPEKTALHTEALFTYIRYRVKEEIATAKGLVKDAKDWGDMASKQATNAKINVAQLSKSDLSDGLDSFSTLVKAVETAVDIIPILPKFKEKPQDKVDFTLWCYVNYVRDLKGLPPAEYKEIYNFYEERKKEYETKLPFLQNDNEDSDVDEEVGDLNG